MATSVLYAQTYEQWMERGLQAAEQDSLEQAEKCFKQALESSPNDYRNALVLSNLGKVQEMMYWRDTQQTRLADNALQSYSLALGMAPESVPLLMSRAKFYLALGMTGKARLDLTNVLDIDSRHLEARALRAYANCQERRFDEAKMDYERVLEQEPLDEKARLGMAVLCQETGKLAEAIERMTQLVETVTDHAEYYSMRAAMYAENHQPELALLDQDKAVSLQPGNTDFLLSRAYLHKQQGNKRLALADFERAIALGVPRASLKKELKECK